jgi:hypothetical protein
MSEDINHLRSIALRLLKTPLREPWQFRFEVEGYPHDDWDLFVKDVTYGPIEIETETEQLGATVLTYPSSMQPVTISMTMREHEDRRVSKWFKSRVDMMVNPDGTVNLPVAYLLKLRRFSLLHGEKNEEQTDVWEVIPTQFGDVTESKDGEGILEFPITFIQFRSTEVET